MDCEWNADEAAGIDQGIEMCIEVLEQMKTDCALESQAYVAALFHAQAKLEELKAEHSG